MYRELTDVFRLMNYKDTNKNFGREIALFERVIVRLEELYQNPNASIRDINDNNEGGNFEIKKSALSDFKNKDGYKDLVQSPSDPDEGSSDITQKPVNDIIVTSNRISIRKLQQQNHCVARFCRSLVNCFTCFRPNQDEMQNNYN